MTAVNFIERMQTGLLRENPALVQLLGLCPLLAVTSTFINGLGLGIATLLVLTCSNVLVSATRRWILAEIRVPIYVLIIASLVTCTELIFKAWFPTLDRSLGIFIPLIVVNCIVLGRSEAFASKNGIFRSLLDGLGIGVGFTLSLSALAAVRELIGTGDLTIWEKPIEVFGPSYQPFSFLVEAPGAFVALGLMLCLMNLVGKK